MNKERDITCCVTGCVAVRAKAGLYPSGTQKYKPLCPHHKYLNRKNLPMEYKTRPPNGRNPSRGCYTRGICDIEGCGRRQVSKGLHRGKQRYDIYCTAHRQLEVQGLPLSMNVDKCSVCGWVGPCDKHRIVAGKDGGEYTEDNIIIVCPNCHRDYHRCFDPHQRLSQLSKMA